MKDLDYSDFDVHQIRHCPCVDPSYENSDSMVSRNPSLYRIAYVLRNERISAFSIFTKAEGHLVQLGYTHLDDIKPVVEHILTKYESITAKNIDITYSDVLESLYSIGFCEVCKQFEMVKTLI